MKFESKLFPLTRVFYTVCFLCFTVNSYVVNAATVPQSNPMATPLPATCDPAFWDVLKDRAWTSAQREITQNNNLIARPDSVLSLSCFGSSLNHLANYSNSHFIGDITNLLNILVLDNLSGSGGYISSNFPADMLGGRGVGLSAQLPSSVSPATYSCSLMNQVWTAAKCYNFNTENSHDGFYSLKTYSTATDYRTKDQQCSNDPRWAGAFSGSNPASGAAGGVDSYVSFLGLMDSSSCSSLTPVKTGLIVREGSLEYYDAVCPAPGCYFNPPYSLSGNGSCN